MAAELARFLNHGPINNLTRKQVLWRHKHDQIRERGHLQIIFHPFSLEVCRDLLWWDKLGSNAYRGDDVKSFT